jgi:hypothetical protein
VSGRSKRRKINHASGMAWRDRVVADVASDAGRRAAHEHHATPALIVEVAELIGGYLAAGESVMSRRDLSVDLMLGLAFASRTDEALGCSDWQMRRLMRFLEERGHVVPAGGDLIRPIGTGAGELPT